MTRRSTVRLSFALSAGALAVACSPDAPTMPKTGSEGFAERGVALDLIPPGQTIPFIPVATSATSPSAGEAVSSSSCRQGTSTPSSRKKATASPTTPT